MFNTRREGLEFAAQVAQKTISDLEPTIKERRREGNFVRANELIAQQQGARAVMKEIKKELAAISPKR